MIIDYHFFEIIHILSYKFFFLLFNLLQLLKEEFRMSIFLVYKFLLKHN